MSRQNRTTCSPDSVTFTLRVDRSSSPRGQRFLKTLDLAANRRRRAAELARGHRKVAGIDDPGEHGHVGQQSKKVLLDSSDRREWGAGLMHLRHKGFAH